MVNAAPGLIFLPAFCKDPFLVPFFLFFINDLSDGLQYNLELIVDHTSLFETMNNISKPAHYLNNDLTKITKLQSCKMTVSPT